MKLGRAALIAALVLSGTALAEPWSHGATPGVPAGLPLYQFSESGTGVLPWNAASLEGVINKTTMLGGPHAISNATEGVVAYRTNHSDLDLVTQSVGAPLHWSDLSHLNSVPAPAADPIPFFDPSGNVDLIYVDSDGHVIVLSQNDPMTTLWHNLRHDGAWRAYVATDLTSLTGVVASNGLASIQVTGLTAIVAYRTVLNNIEVVQRAPPRSRRLRPRRPSSRPRRRPSQRPRRPSRPRRRPPSRPRRRPPWSVPPRPRRRPNRLRRRPPSRHRQQRPRPRQFRRRRRSRVTRSCCPDSSRRSP